MKSKTADNYKMLSPREHVLRRPHMYGGSPLEEERPVYLYDKGSGKFVLVKNVKSPKLLIHMFTEILANAYDNFIGTKKKECDPGEIEITFCKDSVTVKNGGEPIPIVKKDDSNYVPDIIFGNCLSGSNYEDNVQNNGIGQNGIGAKLTNIWSIEFEVKIGDSGFANRKNNLEYSRTWFENMSDIGDRVINTGYVGKSYVQIKYKPDFERFKKKCFDENDIGLMMKIALELSFLIKTKITINGIIYDCSTIEKFSSLFFPEKCKFVSIFSQLGRRFPPEDNKMIEAGIITPNYCIYIFDTTEEFRGKIFSYANGFETQLGGKHVDFVIKKLKKMIKEKYQLNANTLASKITMIVACNLVSPKYHGQTKNALDSYEGMSANGDKDIEITQNDFENIMKLEFFKEYINSLKREASNAPSKVNGKFEKHVNFKGRDANDAGIKDKSNDCMLMIVEGDSAAGYADDRRTRSQGGTNKNGYIIFKGKVMNVEKANQDKIDANKELTELKYALGLKESDTKGNRLDYNDSSVRSKTLRYGKGVLILTDPDSDGMHIACLLLNYFSKIKGFLEAGLVNFLRPPLVRAYNKSNQIAQRFYDFHALNEFLARGRVPKSTKYIYFKGLGSCEKNLYADDLENALFLQCVHDDDTLEALNLCFSKKRADDRKKWIADQRKMIGTIFSTGRQMIPCSEMIMKGMKDYNIETFKRALPGNLDGLKESQRKIVYTALNEWNYGKSNEEIKTGIFSSSVSKATHYQHGEASLTAAIEEMAKDFKGSNNLNWFHPCGNFGDYKGNKAANARYTRVRPEVWVQYAYDKEMVELVPKIKTEDVEIEPEWIPCDLPPYINCIRGIATGFSTFIPPHSAVDACDTVIYYCIHGHIDGLKPIHPYSEGFDCPFEVIDGGNERTTDEGESEEDSEEISIEEAEKAELSEEYKTIEKYMKRKRGKKFRSNGKLTHGRFDNSRKTEDITITELPYGYTANAFESYVKSCLVKEPTVKGKGKEENCKIDVFDSYEDLSSLDDKYEFKIKGFSARSAGMEAYKFFKLEKVYPMTIMNMINTAGIPKYYSKVEEIFMEWAPRMAEIYRLYKEKKIQSYGDQIKSLSDKHMFLSLVRDKIIIAGEKKQYYIDKLANYDLTIDIMKSVTWMESSDEEIKKLTDCIEDLKRKQKKLEDTPHTTIWRERVETLKRVLRDKLGKTSQWDRSS